MERAFLIDWQSGESHVLLNPRMPDADRQRLAALVAAAPPLASHVWLSTSGTTGSLKMTALSKEALLTSAGAVNRHLDSSASDVWGSVLPAFHVGGLGIEARAWLTGARVARLDRWDAAAFAAFCAQERVTLTALVPAQVTDLVKAALRAPSSLRAAVIGGGAFASSLYAAARDLGWPVLPSYGMTECCSQVATAREGSPEMLLLDHVLVRIESDGRIAISSPALLTGYAIDGIGFVDPKRDGWLVTEDLGELEGSVLRVSGRRGEFVKIGGESVDLARLDAILAEIADPGMYALVDLPDERLGHVIALASAAADPAHVVDAFNRRVHPFERIRSTHRVEAIPRTPLGKLRRGELRNAIA